MRLARHVGTQGRGKKNVQGLAGKVWRKEATWKTKGVGDGIKMELTLVWTGGGGVEWIHLAQDRGRGRAL
jgi:hypothetical protein